MNSLIKKAIKKKKDKKNLRIVFQVTGFSHKKGGFF
jgi:hypothetical protein